MSGHIEVMRKAIEFKNPEYIPLEVIEVPGAYHRFGTINSDGVEFVPGTEDFDALQAYYSYTFQDLGRNKQGYPMRRSEWGFVEVLPPSKYDYFIVEYPLASWDNLKRYEFPDPSVTDNFFSRMGKITKKYTDRAIVACIDPGPFLTLSYIVGWENLLASLCTDLNKVKYVFDGIINYNMELCSRWKNIGAHVISFFDEFAGQTGMLISPRLFRKHLKPFYKKIFDHIHSLGMYAGCGLDGKALDIVPDMKEVGLDIFDCRQPLLMGIDNLAKICDGKMCVKGTLDMQRTLTYGTRGEIFKEVEELVSKLGGRNGGFIFIVTRWSVLEYPKANVLASVQAYKKFRSKSGK